MSWCGEVVTAVVESVEISVVDSPPLVKSGRWGFAQLEPVSEQPPLSGLQASLRLAVSFAQLNGGPPCPHPICEGDEGKGACILSGLALARLLAKLLDWLQSVNEGLREERSLALVKGSPDTGISDGSPFSNSSNRTQSLLC